MKQTKNTIFIALFLVLCLLPSLGMLFTGPGAAAANEILAPPPKWGMSVLNETSDYLADHFAFRQSFVSAWSWLHEKLLGASAQEQVVLGEEGWLYYSESLNDYAGIGMSEEELERCAQNLRAMQDALAARGVDFVFTIAPNKNSLYPERMPAAYKNGHDNSNAVRLRPWLERYEVNYADQFEPLSGRVLYYETDSHWNAEGAALGADTILRALGRESDFAAGPFGWEGVHKGDLYEMLYPVGKGREPEQVYRPGHAFTAAGSTLNGNAIRIETDCESGSGTLYCWRDSFGIALYPYLADAYAHAEFSRSAAYDLNKIPEDCDAVILELVERNLSNLLEAPVLP